MIQRQNARPDEGLKNNKNFPLQIEGFLHHRWLNEIMMIGA